MRGSPMIAILDGIVFVGCGRACSVQKREARKDVISKYRGRGRFIAGAFASSLPYKSTPTNAAQSIEFYICKLFRCTSQL
mmetsp:Transcript_44101/g.92760  ORF Transcript_44101/g.92760 Transcript_44101/m.92760 type:complete len:80 (-) Transcript_44101:57-296(-)